jgi:hypothetical protein
LEHLQIPKSSQSLVFSKSSAQLFFISPETPRAIYFNDAVYVGYVPHGGVMEIASLDPQLGPVFYSMDQKKQDRPTFKREPTDCLACHDTFTSEKPVPRLLMLSVLSDSTGVALNRAALITNDASPFIERWGGWYVSGMHGKQRHLGNSFIRTPASQIGEMKEFVRKIDLTAGANVTDLSKRFDAKFYESPYSDIVALMILGHQTHVHNMLSDALHNVRDDSPPDVVKDYGESVVEAMLFSGAAAFTDPISGPTDFADQFSKQGPRDSNGRSLRDLDLKQRLLRYPLSYLVYSKSFDDLPKLAKSYVYGRFREILSGQDKSAKFAHLTEADRKAVFEILKETKADF